MGIKITYSDETTGDILAERTVSDVEIKALGWQMISRTGNGKVVFLDFHDNAIRHLARRRVNEICEEALNDQADTILTKEEKHSIVAELAKSGRIITTVKQMPETIKRQIVSKARIKSAAERQAEEEAAMPE